jgi:2Fe-2S ferredoxin
MPAVTFLLADGRRQVVHEAIGRSVMDAALDHGVPGIRAQCGGGCTCCTCHCYVVGGWRDRFPPPVEDEAALLEYAWQPRPESRLACQLRLTAAHDGLVIEVPAQQA